MSKILNAFSGQGLRRTLRAPISVLERGAALGLGMTAAVGFGWMCVYSGRRAAWI
jgi:hypothetical protein